MEPGVSTQGYHRPRTRIDREELQLGKGEASWVVSPGQRGCVSPPRRGLQGGRDISHSLSNVFLCSLSVRTYPVG